MKYEDLKFPVYVVIDHECSVFDRFNSPYLHTDYSWQKVKNLNEMIKLKNVIDRLTDESDKYDITILKTKKEVVDFILEKTNINYEKMY